MGKKRKKQKRGNIYGEYRRILGKAKFTDREAEKMRHHMRRPAQTICEHVWK